MISPETPFSPGVSFSAGLNPGLPGDSRHHLRVLLIEDSEEDALLVLRELRRGGYVPESRRVETIDEMIQALEEQTWDLIISDYVMPRFSGIEALSLLQKRGQDIPFMIVSGKIGEAVAVEAMRAGAQDYILKDNLARLLPAVMRELSEAAHRRERRNAEEQVRKLSKAVMQSPTSVVIVERSGVIEYVNPQFTAVTGYSPVEVIGKNPRILSSGQTPIEIYRQLWETLLNGRIWRGELLNRRRNGDFYWERNLMSPIRDASGEITHFLAIKEDVNEHKRTEAERQLLERKLQHAQRMEAIGTLAGGIAHDFNNILSAILGFTEVTRDALPQGQERENLEEVLSAAHRAKSLVEQILAFSRRTPNQAEGIRFPTLIEEVMRMIRPLLPGNISLQVEISPDMTSGDHPPELFGNPSELHQVILNLCLNAGHAMRPKGGILKVDLDLVDVPPEEAARVPHLRPGRFQRIRVIDTGCGMEPAVLEHIFEPFFTTRASGEGGSGLGLSVVHGVVVKYGGAVDVVSKPGVGSTFVVFFPVRESQKPDALSSNTLPKD